MSEHILVNGEWKKATKVQLDGIPVGFSLPFRGTQPPFGWLVEDGREVSRTTYAKLFNAIGTLYGDGDGETTFNLPNSIGKYTKFGIGEEIGTELEAGLPNITGTNDYYYAASTPSGLISGAYTARGLSGLGKTAGGGSTYTVPVYDFDASKSNDIYGKSDTVTPPSLVALPCIKAFDTIADEVQINLAAELEALKAQIAGAKFVVESFNNEDTGDWYRVYSDGWIEQGGVRTTQADIAGTVVNLNKAFSGIKYIIVLTTREISARIACAEPVTNGTFKLRGTSTDSKAMASSYSFYACGY